MKTYKTKFGIGDTVYYYTKSGFVQDEVIGISIRKGWTEYAVNKGGIFNMAEGELFASREELIDNLRMVIESEYTSKLKALEELLRGNDVIRSAFKSEPETNFK